MVKQKDRMRDVIQIEERSAFGPALKLQCLNVFASWEVGGSHYDGFREFAIYAHPDERGRPWGNAEIKMRESGARTTRETMMSLNNEAVIALRDWCNRIIDGAAAAKAAGRKDP